MNESPLGAAALSGTSYNIDRTFTSKKLGFKNKVTGFEIAEKISKSLAKEALIISVDGELKDLSFLIQKDSSVKIITHKNLTNAIVSNYHQWEKI